MSPSSSTHACSPEQVCDVHCSPRLACGLVQGTHGGRRVSLQHRDEPCVQECDALVVFRELTQLISLLRK
jgi:hypothetical protein